jgi:LPS O-antigen subunit length determinant protein (WzzB/FepE family)
MKHHINPKKNNSEYDPEVRMLKKRKWIIIAIVAAALVVAVGVSSLC